MYSVPSTADLAARDMVDEALTLATADSPRECTHAARAAMSVEAEFGDRQDAARRLVGLRLLCDLDLSTALSTYGGPIVTVVGSDSQLVAERHAILTALADGCLRGGRDAPASRRPKTIGPGIGHSARGNGKRVMEIAVPGDGIGIEVIEPRCLSSPRLDSTGTSTSEKSDGNAGSLKEPGPGCHMEAVGGHRQLPSRCDHEQSRLGRPRMNSQRVCRAVSIHSSPR